MLITLLDLEREPVHFDLTIPPGAIDYGGRSPPRAPRPQRNRPRHPHPRRLVRRIRSPLRPLPRPRPPLPLRRLRPPLPPPGYRRRPSRARPYPAGNRNRLLSGRWSGAGRRSPRAGAPNPPRKNALPPRLQGTLPALRTQPELRTLHLRGHTGRRAVVGSFRPAQPARSRGC